MVIFYLKRLLNLILYFFFVTPCYAAEAETVMDETSFWQQYIEKNNEAIGVPFSEKTIQTFGACITENIDMFSDAAINAFGAIQSYSVTLLFFFMIIDMGFLFIASGAQLSATAVIEKVTKYGFVYFFISNWSTIINTVFLGFITDVATVFSGNLSMVTESLTQPQFIVKTVMNALTPALNTISNMSTVEFILHLIPSVIIYLASWGTILLFFLVAIKIAIAYVQFYISAIFNIVTLPFVVSGFTKFLPEGMIGNLVDSTIMLICTSFMACFCGMALENLSVATLFPEGSTTINLDIMTTYLHRLGYVVITACLVDKIPTAITNLVGGVFEIE